MEKECERRLAGELYIDSSLSRFKAPCVNSPQAYPNESEDCLTLNVFTPVDASPDNVKKVRGLLAFTSVEHEF